MRRWHWIGESDELEGVKGLTTSQNSVTTTLTYNDASQVLTETNAGGIVGISVNHSYDSQARPASVSVLNGTNTVHEVDYGYDERRPDGFDAKVASLAEAAAWIRRRSLVESSRMAIRCLKGSADNGCFDPR